MLAVKAEGLSEKQEILPGFKRPAGSGQKQKKEEALVLSDKADKEKEQGVNLTISEEAKARYLEQLEAGNEAADAVADLAKIMEIARRIANGDKVPATDEKKLMEFNSDLYQAAKAAALVNDSKEHKEYKSLFDEEEDGVTRSKMRDLEHQEAPAGAETSQVQNMESVGECV